MIKSRVFPEHNYKGIYFNDKTMRIALDPTKPIEELAYPEFYDVKITGYCEGNCPYCYMDSTCDVDHSENIIDKILDYFGSMSKNERPFQVAIGGGEPTTHPQFINSLITFDGLGITPNYTTNGMHLTDTIIKATKDYCGGVAISCHEHLDTYWKYAAEVFNMNGIKLNFHIIISDYMSSNRFRSIYDEFKDMVDYFVLLPHGNIGRGEDLDVDWDYLVSVMPEDTSKIAFGANFHKNLKDSKGLFNVSLYEPESMSKFLDLEDMKLYPSSFHLSSIN